ncbi:MAG: hypothetical protein [Circular genetic element sp.]|nr:MAG: hypothetical protein [Circular genetic element sp.]
MGLYPVKKVLMAGSKLSMVFPTRHLDSRSGGGYTHHGFPHHAPPVPAKVRGAHLLQAYHNARPPAGATAGLHPSSRRSGERRGMYAPAGTPRAFKSRGLFIKSVVPGHRLRTLRKND